MDGPCAVTSFGNGRSQSLPPARVNRSNFDLLIAGTERRRFPRTNGPLMRESYRRSSSLSRILVEERRRHSARCDIARVTQPSGMSEGD
jgi:hypothetical protein